MNERPSSPPNAFHDESPVLQRKGLSSPSAAVARAISALIGLRIDENVDRVADRIDARETAPTDDSTRERLREPSTGDVAHTSGNL